METKVVFFITEFNAKWLKDCNKLGKFIDFSDYQEYIRKEETELEDLQ